MRPPSSIAERLRELELRLHRTLLHALGLELSQLSEIVTRMFAARRSDAVTYWLQLLLSMGIATLGLALDSTAVIIGAMLIAPLMGPIVELGMALVVGSPALTVRSLGRTLGSIVAVVAGAALLTVALPFHELNSEIASRTFPTALDLLIAIFVAFAAVLTTVRASSETAAAAAGAAIGIALVPPLCVMGLGLGIRDLDIAGGATLLFVTNLSAILFISVISFLALGFETVSANEWEKTTLESARPNGLTARATGALRWGFGSRYSRVLRIAIPAVLVASVSVPLARALNEVAWEVSARNAVARILDETLSDVSAVQRTVSVQSGAVTLQLYVVASMEEAAALERELEGEIESATNVSPAVSVVAVPDQALLRQPRISADPNPAMDALTLAEFRTRMSQRLEAVWPGRELGPLMGWYLRFPNASGPTIVAQYEGVPAGAGVEAMIARSLSERMGTELSFVALPAASASDEQVATRGMEWLPNFIRGVETVRGSASTLLCVQIPQTSALGAEGRRVEEVVRAEVAGLPAARWSLQQGGDTWGIRIDSGTCEQSTSTDSLRASPDTIQ